MECGTERSPTDAAMLCGKLCRHCIPLGRTWTLTDEHARGTACVCSCQLYCACICRPPFYGTQASYTLSCTTVQLLVHSLLIVPAAHTHAFPGTKDCKVSSPHPHRQTLLIAASILLDERLQPVLPTSWPAPCAAARTSPRASAWRADVCPAAQQRLRVRDLSAAVIISQLTESQVPCATAALKRASLQLKEPQEG
jgi:hypothetical protein